MDAHGRFLYDTLQHEMPNPAFSRKRLNQPTHQSTSKHINEERMQRCVSLGEFRSFMEPAEDEIHSNDSLETGTIGCATKGHKRRRFSVDLGEVREFIAITELRVAPTDTNKANTKH